ncbi:hypothetical protein [Zavarzinella formosa]|uniref:hypothetical protein n=1 Tax=Zavarzinella formosa TaxID=360055 RepID=UPI0002E9D8C4|nr:hypothetical protein [Zavarzinella formosa]
MFSKILAGALGIGVIAVGGVVYFQYGTSHNSCCMSSKKTEADTTTSSCCGDLSRSEAVHSCCSSEDVQAVSTVAEDGREVLAIAPREVSE